MDVADKIFAGVSLLLTGVGGTKLFDYLLSRSKLQIAAEEKEAELPFEQQSLIVADLRARISALEKSHADCMHDRIETAEKFGKLQGMCDEQRARIEHMEREHVRQNTQVLQATGAANVQVLKTTGEAMAKQVVATAEIVAAAKSASDSGAKLPPVDADHPLPVVVVDPKNIHE